MQSLNKIHAWALGTDASTPLANCVHDVSCREKLVPISPKGLKVVGQTDFCVHR